MKIKWEHIPEDIRSLYNLESMIHDGYIYVKIKKGMYGLKEAAILAYKKSPEDIILSLALRAYGDIQREKQLSAFVWMTLESNIFQSLTHIT